MQNYSSDFILHGCKTWRVTLREGCGLRVFGNRVLRETFGAEREVTGEWSGLHNEDIHDLLSPPNIIRVVIWKSKELADHLAS
jgi:hypothetical protein